MKKYEYSEIKDKIRTEGRVIEKDGALIIGWEGSGFEFRGEFSGKITMDVKAQSDFYYDKTYWLNLYYVVDGVPFKTDLIHNETQTLEIADVEKGFHTVKVIKNSQAIFNTLTVKALNFDGILYDAPEKKKTAIEFIGDSISAGSVVMSYEKEPADLEIDSSSDSYYFYPGVTCRALGAELFDVSTGGVGIVNLEGGFCTKPDIYYCHTEYYHDRETMWDFEKNKMDVVVIALGTNDGAYHEKQAEYKELCRKFLRFVREKNPDSFIYWIYGMMFRNFENTLKELIDEENDGKMKFLAMPTDNRGGYDHPGKAAHAEYGRILSEDIKKTLNI